MMPYNCKIVDMADIQLALVFRGLFYLQIRIYILADMVKMTFFQSKMDLLSANSRFAVQNDGTYLPEIARETCTASEMLLMDQKNNNNINSNRKG